MYSLLDRPTDALDPGSRLLVTAMRAWVLAIAARRCPRQGVAQVLAEAEAPPLADRFHRLMRLLHREGNQPMRFGQMAKPRITEAEALMLTLWIDMAEDRAPRALATIELMVKPIAIGPMLNLMLEIVAHLSTARLAPVRLTH
ncbi:hypothetical protein L6Q21_06355 [Sandaracinobacter sp. RS1-74]|uniref:hypothetical protein n=1 Tax=Sandaracinobacteroides sayramensis TaxID=2913411 RepID=UPI001EDA38BC|nr:hypothetical protein [Sandaracinobacteroides sayramensis]MCG2840600.1 hypothetical protein [Sandaracinobacteroides sayramensis]